MLIQYNYSSNIFFFMKTLINRIKGDFHCPPYCTYSIYQGQFLKFFLIFFREMNASDLFQCHFEYRYNKYFKRVIHTDFPPKRIMIYAFDINFIYSRQELCTKGCLQCIFPYGYYSNETQLFKQII